MLHKNEWTDRQSNVDDMVHCDDLLVTPKVLEEVEHYLHCFFPYKPVVALQAGGLRNAGLGRVGSTNLGECRCTNLPVTLPFLPF